MIIYHKIRERTGSMDKKIIWGLDLGLTSVGWAVVKAGLTKTESN